MANMVSNPTANEMINKKPFIGERNVIKLIKASFKNVSE